MQVYLVLYTVYRGSVLLEQVVAQHRVRHKSIYLRNSGADITDHSLCLKREAIICHKIFLKWPFSK